MRLAIKTHCRTVSCNEYPPTPYVKVPQYDLNSLHERAGNVHLASFAHESRVPVGPPIVHAHSPFHTKKMLTSAAPSVTTGTSMFSGQVPPMGDASPTLSGVFERSSATKMPRCATESILALNLTVARA